MDFLSLNPLAARTNSSLHPPLPFVAVRHLRGRRNLRRPSPPQGESPRPRRIAFFARAGLHQSQEADSLLQTHPRWREFADRVSGEWDGFGAEFSSRGKPIELPENVVPSAFREWEVQVFDWQTQCPTLADPANPSLVYKLIRLLPTVGCEADAATRHSVEEKTIDESSTSGDFVFAYDKSGSYVAVWGDKKPALEIEHCLFHPKNHEIRIRVVQRISMGESGAIVGKIDVFSEQWYGPFRNGEQLGGCAVRESGFASTAATEESLVLGLWQSSRVFTIFSDCTNNQIRNLEGQREEKLVRGKEGLVTLPKQLWSSSGKMENGESWVEVGWMIDQGQAITSRCIFSEDRNLKVIAVGCDSLIQEDASVL